MSRFCTMLAVLTVSLTLFVRAEANDGKSGQSGRSNDRDSHRNDRDRDDRDRRDRDRDDRDRRDRDRDDRDRFDRDRNDRRRDDSRRDSDFLERHGERFSDGYRFYGRDHDHWTERRWFDSYGCYCYYCPYSRCYYYWSESDYYYYPVSHFSQRR